jgi:predicted GIY-YIG superfamily endonuclease
MSRWSPLKRRTLRKFSSGAQADHHHVYVVQLDPAVAALRKVRALNPQRRPDRGCVYVGMTGLSPDERLANHLRGIKASYFVKRYGIRLLPELYEHLNPMPFAAATQMEKDLAEDLRRNGYTVVGGH